MPVILNPYIFFFLSWFLSLVFLSFSVTKVSFDNYYIACFFFLFSSVSFFIGNVFYKLLKYLSRSTFSRNVLYVPRYSVEHIVFFLLSCAFLIVIFNFYSDGYPPFFRYVGLEAKHYIDYGRFVGLLIPLLSAAVLFSMLSDKFFFKLFVFLFVYSVFLLYVLRGPMIISFFQVFLVFIFLEYMRKRSWFYLRFSLISFCVLFFMLYFFSFLGTQRSGEDSFYEYLRVTDVSKDQYSLPFLWLATYFSIPLSNFLWFFQEARLDSIDIHFLTKLLPAFLISDSTAILIKINNLGGVMIDGVHFYLFYWYSGMGFFGVFLINFIYGFLSKAFFKNILLYSVIVSCLMFLFFIDYLFYFPVFSQIVMIFFLQKKRESSHVNS